MEREVEQRRGQGGGRRGPGGCFNEPFSSPTPQEEPLLIMSPSSWVGGGQRSEEMPSPSTSAEGVSGEWGQGQGAGRSAELAGTGAPALGSQPCSLLTPAGPEGLLPAQGGGGDRGGGGGTPILLGTVVLRFSWVLRKPEAAQEAEKELWAELAPRWHLQGALDLAAPGRDTRVPGAVCLT